MAVQIIKNLDLERLVKAVLKDEWMLKTGVGGILAAGSIVAVLYHFVLLPVSVALLALMIGYCLRCMRTKAANADVRLPDWNEWGDLFLSGITWIALQFGIWLAFCSFQAFIIIMAISCAYTAANKVLCVVCLALGCGVVSLSFFLMMALSAYTMVNFAIEENARAGLAYLKVARKIMLSPSRMLLGFLLSQSIQWAALIIPCLTIIGVFLVPSAFFFGQIVSSIVLSRFWCSVATEES